MYLRSLEINGFKSFARKGELSFTTPITAIVGPNGSGKSNVAEAFRFVLGEQSLKSMRGKRGEDLIFNGSSSVSRANRAGVKITLDNTAKQFPIDFDEVTIERIVFRDGTNEYLLNGSRTRLKDVQELLASANIGSTGHHIISQGEADRILSASPKERREMIEDALGLKVFQYKKTESERKLAKTKENIMQVEALRREASPHLRFLERQVKKIEKSLEVKEQLTVTYAEYLKREDEYIAFHHDRILKDEEFPRGELAKLEQELTFARKILEDAEKDEKRDALVAIEGKLRISREKRQEVTREVGKLEGQIAYLERRIAERARKQAEQQHKPAVPFESVERIIINVENLADGAQRVTDSGALLRTIEHMVRTLRSFLNDVSREGEKVEEANHDEDDRDGFVSEKKKLDHVLAQIEKEEEEFRVEYDALKKSIEAEASESREAEREVFRIMGREQEVRQKLSSLEREKQSLERDRNEFKRELEEAVSLIGRGATEYFDFSVLDDKGETLSREALVSEDRNIQLERRRQLEKMKIRLEELGAGSTDDILKEYKDARERDEFLAREIEDLLKSVTSLEGLVTELAEELNSRFVEGIEKIGKEFSTFFVLMFGGGSAALHRVKPTKRAKKEATEMEELLGNREGEEEEESVLEEGIELDVSLPNKRVRGLDMLSGGERALTSIALIFAMSQVNPPPFVILDETDAALDEANSRRYGDMIASLAQKSQLILITHNRETMSRAGVLYGVTMSGDGASKLLSVKLEEAVEVAK